MSAVPDQNIDSPRGFTYALCTYLIWGLMPIYMKALAHIPAPEVIAHRVVWSLPIAAAVLFWQGRSDDVIAALRNPRLLAMAALTAVLISINWLVYVWAVGNGHALDAALGYYINPLFSILLGATLLGERLLRLQWIAIGLAAIAVVILTMQSGKLPIVAVVLMISWGLYAYCKKRLPLGANQGFTLEVLLLLPVALAYLGWLAVAKGRVFGDGSSFDIMMLMGCGVITAVPLLLYANAAKLLRLSTIGIMQYITPTMIMLVAVLLFDEPFGAARMAAFPLIWIGMVLYSISLMRQAGDRRRRRDDLTKRMQ